MARMVKVMKRKETDKWLAITHHRHDYETFSTQVPRGHRCKCPTLSEAHTLPLRCACMRVFPAQISVTMLYVYNVLPSSFMEVGVTDQGNLAICRCVCVHSHAVCACIYVLPR